MGLARELTLGTSRSRTRKQIGQAADYAALRRLTEIPAPDLDRFRVILDRVGASADWQRQGEGVIYLTACARYRDLTGEDYGPEAA